MGVLADQLPGFIQAVTEGETEIYNEFSLQHELGIWLRQRVKGSRVQFERNVTYFFDDKSRFTKREIDVSLFSPDRSDLLAVIELKFPRNGQYPEQMYSFVKDIVFLEELKTAGFREAGLVIFADDHNFYRGQSNGIYGYFRSGKVLHGQVRKPTGRKDEELTIQGNYIVTWKPIIGKLRFAVVEV